MELAEATMWSVVVALVTIPLCYYFWRRWDRPSRAALSEQDRRLQERETREAFLIKDEKSREHEHQQSLVQLQERKKIYAMAPTSAAMTFALSSLDGEDSDGQTDVDGGASQGPLGGVNEIQRSEEEIALLEQIPESVEVPDIEADESVSDILEDTGPISLKVEIALPEEVKPKATPELPEEVKLKATPEPTVDEIDWPEWE